MFLGFQGLVKLPGVTPCERRAPFFGWRQYIASRLHLHLAPVGVPKDHWRSDDRIVHAMVNCRSRKVDLPSWEPICPWHPSWAIHWTELSAPSIHVVQWVRGLHHYAGKILFADRRSSIMPQKNAQIKSTSADRIHKVPQTCAQTSSRRGIHRVPQILRANIH